MFTPMKFNYHYQTSLYRYDLLSRLIADTDLSTRPNSQNENLLLFLVQTVGRQMVEQRQYRPSKTKVLLIEIVILVHKTNGYMIYRDKVTGENLSSI